MSRITALFLVCTITGAPTVVAQQSNHWFFGHSASLDFTGGVATPATGSLIALEGTSTISDAGGDPLFYTNGVDIWDRNNNIMPNGSGLMGGPSSTQAALIVPKPGACGIFYVFTTQDHQQSGDFRYSIVDMCLNNGNGDVVAGQKNILIDTPCSEKLTAVPNTNGTDWWIITHRLSSDQFLAFTLTPGGFNTTPVISATGSFHASNCMIGPLKASHNGQKLVCVNMFCSLVELFDFDANTGAVSNPVDLMGQYNIPNGVYGAEFGPSDELLYLSTTYGVNRIYQIDLVGSQSLLVHDLGSGGYYYGALQLAPDGRIYMARKDDAFLDAITLPDVVGTGCTFQSPGINLLAGTTSDIGMPCVIPADAISSPVDTLQFSIGQDTALCGPVPIMLHAPAGCASSYLWSTGATADHTIAGLPGTYWLQMSNACGTGTDTIMIGDGTHPDSSFSSSMIDNDPAAWQFDRLAPIAGCPGTWDFGDGSPIVTGDIVQHTYPGNGVYTVCLSVHCPCKNVITHCEQVVIVSLGIHVSDGTDPTATFIAALNCIILRSDGLGSNRLVRLLDAQGREVATSMTAKEYARFDASSLSPGVYLVQAIHADGSSIVRRVAVFR